MQRFKVQGHNQCAFNDWDCTDRSQVTWDPCEHALSLLIFWCTGVRSGTTWQLLRAASHTRLRACDQIHFKHSHWWKKAEPDQVCFTLRLRDQRSVWMQDGCKLYMDSYMATNRSCFMVTWTIFKTHLLEVGLTQSRETMAHRTLTSVDLFYFTMCEDPHEHKCIE